MPDLGRVRSAHQPNGVTCHLQVFASSNAGATMLAKGRSGSASLSAWSSPLAQITICCAVIYLSSHVRIASAIEEATAEDSGLLTRWRQQFSSSQTLGTGVHTKFSLTPINIAGLALACVCALLANAAGIGGGPIYIPLFTVLLGFDITEATALSHTTVATSAVASSVYGLIARSPNDPNRPLIDWDIAVAFIPALLIGVSVGVLFNALLPSIVQVVLLTALLLVVIRHTLAKGKKMWKSEKKDAVLKKAAEHPLHEDSDSETEGILHEEAYHVKPHLSTRQSLQRDIDRRSLTQNQNGGGEHVHLLPHEEAEQQHGMLACFHRLPIGKITLIVALWALFLGSQAIKVRFDRCSLPFLGFFIAQLVILTAFTGAGLYFIAAQARSHPDDVDPELRDVLLESQDGSSSDKKGPVRRLAVVAAVMAASGLIAGLLGIGGALIFNPFLLQLGVHPQVTASTSVLMILFSSSAIAVSLAFQGYLNVSYALVFAPLAFVSSTIGVTLISRVIKKTGHTSIIVFLLAGLIALGTVMTALFGGMRAYHEVRSGKGFHFAFC